MSATALVSPSAGLLTTAVSQRRRAGSHPARPVVTMPSRRKEQQGAWMRYVVGGDVHRLRLPSGVGHEQHAGHYLYLGLCHRTGVGIVL